MEKLIWAVSTGLLFTAPVQAQNNDESAPVPRPDRGDETRMREAAWDWRPGDLIFRNGVNDIDDAMKRSFGLQWASVGILRPSSGGPRVAYVDQSDGVTEEMLYEHVEGLSSDKYAVYRAPDLNPNYDPEEQMWPGPLVRFALFITYGQSFDDQFMLGDGALYNAELAYASALNAGIVLGSPIRLRNLVTDVEDLDPELRKVLEAHQYCRYELTFEDCWTYNLQEQSIVTPDSLISSGELDQVYP